MRSPALVALVAMTLVPLLAPSGVDAKPRKRGKTAAAGKASSACGATMLPLTEGNQWTYSTIPAPLPATPDIVKISPALPKGFVITVKSVTQRGEDTVVTLEEKLTYDMTKDVKKPNVEERIVTSTITCSGSKFDISPESFFFAGEPGGYAGLSLDKLERKGTSWKLAKGVFGDAEWPEDLVITWARRAADGSGAAYGGGKLELERRFIPQDAEAIVTKGTSYTADKIAVTTTGRVTLDKPLTAGLAPMELPADWINQLWIVNGTGVVQSLNRYAHMYQLVDAQLK
jgi:hypothetical protein